MCFNKQIDVIIPTMLCSDLDIFWYTLYELKNSPLINKIIIIDNTDNNDFDKNFQIDDDFLIIKPIGNIFVNPSWNLGVANVKTKYYIILNDDILLKKEAIDLIYRKYREKKDIRLLYVNHHLRSNNYSYDDEINSYNLLLNNLKNLDVQIFDDRGGSFIMGAKDEWINIPHDLKIFCGDDYIFDITKYRFPNKKNYIIKTPLMYHYDGKTVSKTKNIYDHFFHDTKLLCEKYFPDKSLNFYKKRFSTNHLNGKK